jgi:transposase-like protein
MFNAPHFQSPEAAREYLEALRWGSDRVCPHCGTVNESFSTKKPGVYRCRTKGCRKDFSVTTKSVMESSHIKLNVWLQAFFLMASSKKGISSHQLHRALGITYKSAWFLTHRIREAMRVALGTRFSFSMQLSLPSSSLPSACPSRALAMFLARPLALPQNAFELLSR